MSKAKQDQENHLPRGWFTKLLRKAEFTPRIPVVDPPEGRRLDLQGSRRDWLAGLKAVGETDLTDVHRAMYCMVSKGCKRGLVDVAHVAFINGYLYIEYEDAEQIERWVPEATTVALREAFDQGQEPPVRFMMSFRAARGYQRLEARRATDRASRRARPGERARRGTKVARRVNHKTTSVPNAHIRNGILIAEAA